MNTEKSIDVTVIGCVGIDTCIYLHGQEIDFKKESNFTENVDCIGQAGGYAAMGFQSLGLSTALIDTVGDDDFGGWIRRDLASKGIDLRGLFIDPNGTRRSINIMSPDGRRRNFYDGKGAMTFRPDVEKCKGLLSGTRWAHVNIINWARFLLPTLKELGVGISVDLQDVVEIDDEYRRDFLRYADIVFFSSVNVEGSLEKAMESILAKYAARVVISGRGAKGVMVGTKDDGIRHYPAVDMEFPVVDSNGAGDSLAVGFISSHVFDSLPIEESIHRAQTAARYCCSLRAGAAGSKRLIDKRTLEELIFG